MIHVYLLRFSKYLQFQHLFQQSEPSVLGAGGKFLMPHIVFEQEHIAGGGMKLHL